MPKYTLKEANKIIKQKEKRNQYQSQNILRPKLIHWLINIKSWKHNIYQGEDRRQLLFILKRQKEWTGDVLNYFMWNHSVYRNLPNRFAPKNGMSKNDKVPFLLVADDMPF